MTNRTALIELRDKVRAGEFPADLSARHLGLDVTMTAIYAAFSGYLDAAKALHDTLVPDKSLIIYRSLLSISGGTRVQVGVSGDATHEIPARAWLLAILDALIEEPQR